MHSEYLLILPQKYVSFYTVSNATFMNSYPLTIISSQKLNNELKTNPIGVYHDGETIRRIARHIVKRPYPILPLLCSLDNKEFRELCIQQAWGSMHSDYELDKFLAFIVFSGEFVDLLLLVLDLDGLEEVQTVDIL